MSIKAQILDNLFYGLPPANTYNFFVMIGSGTSESLISAFAMRASWLSQKRPSLSVRYKGKSFELPAYTEESSGSLNIGFHENAGFVVREQLRKLLEATDNPMQLNLFDIWLVNLSPTTTPMALTVFSNCFLSERSVMQLSADQVTIPANWDSQFRYNGIHEQPLLPNTPSFAYIEMEKNRILELKGRATLRQKIHDYINK